MGGVALSQLAAAVTNAGGFGCMGSLMSATKLREEIRALKRLTSGPWGVDILAGTPHLVESVKVIIEEGGKVFVTGRGTAPEIIDLAHDGGLKVGCVCGAIKHAVSVRPARIPRAGLGWGRRLTPRCARRCRGSLPRRPSRWATTL